MNKKIYIPGGLQNAAVDNEGNRLPVSGAEDIEDAVNFPEDLKTQAEINADTLARVAAFEEANQ